MQQDKDKIDDIEFVLGSNSAHCLMEATNKFGGEIESKIPPSVFSVTAAGIMLLGNIDHMKNLA